MLTVGNYVQYGMKRSKRTANKSKLFLHWSAMERPFLLFVQCYQLFWLNSFTSYEKNHSLVFYLCVIYLILLIWYQVIMFVSCVFCWRGRPSYNNIWLFNYSEAHLKWVIYVHICTCVLCAWCISRSFVIWQSTDCTASIIVLNSSKLLSFCTYF